MYNIDNRRLNCFILIVNRSLYTRNNNGALLYAFKRDIDFKKFTNNCLRSVVMFKNVNRSKIIFHILTHDIKKKFDKVKLFRNCIRIQF